MHFDFLIKVRVSALVSILQLILDLVALVSILQLILDLQPNYERLRTSLSARIGDAHRQLEAQSLLYGCESSMLLRLPRRLPHCHSHLGLIPLRSGDYLSRRVMDGSMRFAVNHWWSNQAQPPYTMCEVVFQKEQRVVRVALSLNRTLRYVVGLLPTFVPLNSLVILPARSHSRD